MSFGTLKSRLRPLLESAHYDAKLTEADLRAVKCWIDLNCPLWPDYQFRPDRPASSSSLAELLDNSRLRP